LKNYKHLREKFFFWLKKIKKKGKIVEYYRLLSTYTNSASKLFSGGFKVRKLPPPTETISINKNKKNLIPNTLIQKKINK